MKDGELALYVEEMEKKAFAKGVLKAFKEAGGAAKRVGSAAKKSYKAKFPGKEGIAGKMKRSAGMGAAQAKKEWKSMSRGAKAATIGTGVTGLAAGGYAAKKILD